MVLSSSVDVSAEEEAPPNRERVETDEKPDHAKFI